MTKKSNFGFRILKKSKKSKARLGILETPHGQIKTPAFVTVGTKATVKSLDPKDLNKTDSQLIFVNTYHTVLSPGVAVIEKAGGIHQYTGIGKPIITDSGGFQVFSLGRGSTQKGKKHRSTHNNHQPPVKVKVTSDGVEFRSPIDGKKFFFTSEFSIEAQKKIGGDLMVAFDECTYYKASHKYTKEAMQRTHDWAVRSLEASKLKVGESQKLFGVIQGGMYEDLRKKSTQFIASLPFFGLAIGGVSVGETKGEMREQIKWVIDVVKQDERPRHLLGVGEIDDIFDTILMGIDMMDCVIPTRHARMGKLYQNNKLKIKNKKQLGELKKIKMIDIFKSIYRDDLSPLSKDCFCYTCTNFTKSYLHHLFKQKELLGYRLSTLHNLSFMERFFDKIRSLIGDDII